MTRIDVDKLFAGSNPTPVVAIPTPAPSAPNNTLKNLIVGALILVTVWYCYTSWKSHQGDGGKKDDQQQVEPGPKPDPKPNPKPISKTDGFVIFVHELTPMTTDRADILDAAAALHETNPKLEYRSYDDDDDTPDVRKVVDYAKSKGFEPPCVVFKDRDGNFVSAGKFPKNDLELKEFLK